MTYCAGGNCSRQCLYCLTLDRAEKELARRCVRCGLLLGVCSCQSSKKKLLESKHAEEPQAVDEAMCKLRNMVL